MHNCHYCYSYQVCFYPSMHAVIPEIHYFILIFLYNTALPFNIRPILVFKCHILHGSSAGQYVNSGFKHDITNVAT